MALQDLLDLSQNRKKIGLSEERIRAIIPAAREYISFWREYPDLFVDFMKGPDNTFNLFFCFDNVYRLDSQDHTHPPSLYMVLHQYLHHLFLYFVADIQSMISIFV